MNGIKDFQVTDITTHRNGIAGRGFYSVRFSFCEGFTSEKIACSTVRTNMLAIMPHSANQDVGVECFVIDMNEPTKCWRGDNFAPLIWDAIRAAHVRI